MSTIINATTTNGVVIQPDNSGSLVLQTNSGTTALTISTAQNVGIGTASPTAKLQANVTSAGSNTTPLVVSNTSATTSTECSIGFSPFSDTSVITGSIGLLNQGSGAYSLKFSNWNGSANTERMRIDGSGNVLIGTTSQLSFGRFCVSVVPGVNDGITTKPTTNTTYLANAFLNSSGTTVGSISVTSSATSYITSSDYRLKENIVPMTGALDKVAQLKPVTYTWKEDGSDGQGFIAHELQAVVPDCVTGEKDDVDEEGNPKYQGIDTSFLVATLTAAIQEMKAIIDAQSVTINDLKARVEILEAK